MEGIVKTILNLIAILTIAFCNLFAEGGQTVTNSSFQFGSVEAVEEHQIPFIEYGVVGVYQTDTNGNEINFNNVVYWGSVLDKQELDEWFQFELQKGLNNILTSTNGNREGTYKIWVSASSWTLSNGLFEYFKEFKLIYSNGQYSVPDFSQARMPLTRGVLYNVPNIQWAILEICDRDGYLIDYQDSRTDTNFWSGGVDPTHGVLILPTEYIIGNTNYRVKLVVVSNNGDYRAYDGTGKQIEETPVRFNIQHSDYRITVSVISGDVGRQLTLQWSTNMANWFDLTSAHVVGYAERDSGFSYTETNTLSLSGKFFRVKKDVKLIVP